MKKSASQDEEEVDFFFQWLKQIIETGNTQDFAYIIGELDQDMLIAVMQHKGKDGKTILEFSKEHCKNVERKYIHCVQFCQENKKFENPDVVLASVGYYTKFILLLLQVKQVTQRLLKH